MKITRDVILDLLPLYLSDEVSADTRAIVEEYLEKDRELARIAAESKSAVIPKDAPTPLTKEDEMEAYDKAKNAINRRIITLAAIIAFGGLSLLCVSLLALFFLLWR